MSQAVLSMARTIGWDLRKTYFSFCTASLEAAIKEQGLGNFVEQCAEIVPDLSKQYTESFSQSDYDQYFALKLRGVHAFQVSLFLRAMQEFDRRGLSIVDIGDSCGNHAKYFKALSEPGKIGKFLSVNLDPEAVAKVKESGGEALLCRAEELPVDIHVDLYTSFEMLEHLTDPMRFLYRLANAGRSEYFLMTVPYRKVSRFGGNPVRYPLERLPGKFDPEATHFFELSVKDWSYLAGFSGWTTVWHEVYLQYPKYSPLVAMKPFWKKYDFEGFAGLFLKRDLSRASRYTGW